MRKRNRKNQKGQAIVEYIIIIVIVAVAALTVMGLFSDTLRKKMAGAISSLTTGDEADSAASDADTSSREKFKTMDTDGM